MAAALAEVVLKKLGSLAAAEASLLWNLKSEILKLKSTVLTIQAVLLDAEEQSGQSAQIQLWLRDLTEAFYDAEDLLDDFSTEVLRRNQMDGNSIVNEVGLFFSPDNQIAYGLKIAHQIKAIQSKLAEIAESRNFHLDARPVVDNLDWRETDSFICDVVVGREEDKKTIIGMLLSSSYAENVAVVPIIGFGGLGKTTLAQDIYHHESLDARFTVKIWVCVSENFDEKSLVKQMLVSVTKDEVKDLSLDAMKHMLHEKLNKKKFLLVLDDVWDKDGYRNTWHRLKGFLGSMAAVGSRIVVTTRIWNVAHLMATSGINPYELQGLSPKDSRALFEQVAFGGLVQRGPRYLEVGEEIVQKCKGVPLIVRAMAGLLSSKTDVNDWVAIRNKQVLINIDDQERIILATLRLSYDHLPSHLKRCFSYCSLFPKDSELDVKMLTQLWMAQGYVTKSSQPSPFDDVGVEHFKNLLGRSFFQEVTKDKYGNMKSCKMHDLMHDLAVTVSGEETISLNASALTDTFLNSGTVNLERIRHLSIHFENIFRAEVWKVPTVLSKATKLRTFLLLTTYCSGLEMDSEGCEMIFSNMTRLRVLSLGDITVNIVSSTIHKTKHLRYLAVCNPNTELLPEEITRLINLQVLRLRSYSNLRQLPTDIAKLSNLAYLDIDQCWNLSCMPIGIGKLTCLRELSLFVVTEATVAERGGVRLGELKHLNNLTGKLCIEGLEWVTDKSEAEAANLKGKSQLLHLKLVWNSTSSRASDDNVARRSDYESSILEALQPHPNLRGIQLSGYRGTSITTSWFSSLRNLVRLRLRKCTELRTLPSLDPFIYLEELELSELDSLEYVQSETVPSSPSPRSSSSNSNGDDDSQFHSSLKSLLISNCHNLIGWCPANTEAPLLHRVSQLVIRDCPKMVSFPRFVVQFERIELLNVSSELVSEFSASLVSPSPPSTDPRSCFLSLGSMKDLRVLAQGLLPRLTSLQELLIWGCDDLELENSVYDDSGDENNMSECVLPNLRVLVVSRVAKLVTLPRWLQHSSNLQQLNITKCDNLECLPSWLTKLTSLDTLEINECNLLSGRCRSCTGEDWPNIYHVPNIKVDYRMIQQDGRYLRVEKEAEEERQGQRKPKSRFSQQAVEEEQRGLLEMETEAHTEGFSRMFANCIGRLTCNLFQRCFMP